MILGNRINDDVSRATVASVELRSGTNITWERLARFSGSVVSRQDIELLRSIIRGNRSSARRSRSDSRSDLRFTEGDHAGKAALATVTRAGYCDLAADIRPWLMDMEDFGEDIDTSGPHVLNICVKDFGDGNALRVLFEFADSRNSEVRLHLDDAIASYSDDGVAELLQRSRTHQIASLIPPELSVVNNRQLSVLKTFVDDERTVDFLTGCTRSGWLYALLSLLFADRALDWSYFEYVEIADRYQADLYVNAMLQNVVLGADPAHALSSPKLRRSEELANQFEDGLALVRTTG